MLMCQVVILVPVTGGGMSTLVVVSDCVRGSDGVMTKMFDVD